MRLLNRHRERIADLLTDRKFDPLDAALTKKKQALARRIYRSQVTEQIEKQADALEKACPGIVKMDNDVIVYTKEAGTSIRMPFGFNLPMPDGRMECKPKSADDEFYDEITEIILEHLKLIADRSAARQTAWLALDKFTTFEKLEEAWPDVMPIVREACSDMPKPVAQLPAIATADLNALFDLPPETVETDNVEGTRDELEPAE